MEFVIHVVQEGIGGGVGFGGDVSQGADNDFLAGCVRLLNH